MSGRVWAGTRDGAHNLGRWVLAALIALMVAAIFHPGPAHAQEPPVITRLDPTHGATNESAPFYVLIEGSGFTGATDVLFGDSRSEFIYAASDGQMIALLPLGLVGTVDVRVITSAGSSATGPQTKFRVVGPPVITSVVADRAGYVKVYGYNLIDVYDVDFGSTETLLYNVNEDGTYLYAAASLPYMLSYPIGVTVRTRAGEASGSGRSPEEPTVTAASPSTVSTSGGQLVTLTGTHFQPGLYATKIQINGFTVNYGNMNVESSTSLTFVAPPGVAGPATITVDTFKGISPPIGGLFSYSDAPAPGVPTVTALSPSTGPTEGGTSVTVTGTGFVAGATSVTIGGTALPVGSVTVAGPTSLSFTTLAHPAGVAEVTVTTADGTSAALPGGFTYQAPAVPAPVAEAVTTTVPYGATSAPVALTLTGGTAESLAIVGAPSHGTVTVSGLTIAYTSAAGYAGPDSFTYTATGAGGTSAPATVSVTVSPPTITLDATTLSAAQVGAAYSQTRAATGGTGPYSYAITIGALPDGLTLDPATGAISGTPTAAGISPFTLRARDASTGTGPFETRQAFAITVSTALPPTLSSLSPSSGPDAGGTTVALVGTNFIAGSTAVTIGGATVPASSVTVTSPTSLSFVTPAHAAGVVTVSVSTPEGASGSPSSGFSYVSAPLAPNVSGLSPSQGPDLGGTLVTISGVGFMGATSVSFGGVSAQSFTVVSDTRITALSPPGSGVVQVFVTTPVGVNLDTGAAQFAYTGSPSQITAVPTMTEWGLLILALVVGLFGATGIHRRLGP